MAKGSVRKKGKKWYYRFYVEDESGRQVQREFAGTESKSETEALRSRAFRQAKAENVVSADAGETDVLNRRELSEGNIEDHLASVQIDCDVRRLVAALPDNQREVLEMRYYRDMSFKEIADQTNVSINTALGRMRYAIINMRRLAERNHIALTV